MVGCLIVNILSPYFYEFSNRSEGKKLARYVHDEIQKDEPDLLELSNYLSVPGLNDI